MELVVGKKFKLEVWESILKAMAVGEVAKFIVHKSVSKSILVSTMLQNASVTQDTKSLQCLLTFKCNFIQDSKCTKLIFGCCR